MFTPKVYSKIWSRIRIRNDYLFRIRISPGQKGPDLTESDPTGTVSESERIQYELRYPSSLPAILVNAVDTEMRMREEIVHCTKLWDTVQIKRVIHKSPQSWKPHGAKKFVIKPVCRDSSEINHCMLLISFGKSGSYLPPYVHQRHLNNNLIWEEGGDLSW